MRTFLSIIPLFFFIIGFSQSDTGNVGINTPTPERTLDVNGNLRAEQLLNKTNDSGYRSILAKDMTNGNIDIVSFPSLEQSATKNVEIKKTIYLSNTPIKANTCSCGELTFYMDTNNFPYFRLNSENVFTSLGSDSFTLGFGVKKWSFTTTEATYSYKNIPVTGTLTITKAGYLNNNQMDNTAFSSNLTTNDVRVYTIVLPKQNNLYKLTISKLQNADTVQQYGLVCEKFYISEI